MIVYIDDQFMCHATNSGDYRSVESPFFDDKCVSFIEGYRFVPDGETWISPDGRIFVGTIICPAVDVNRLLVQQAQYDLDAAYDALHRLGVET